MIMVSDRAYAEKADGRRGGVGTETQIISPQIYAKADQNKFVAVVPELDADGKPFLPTYYGARIFIDLSNQEIYPEIFYSLCAGFLINQRSRNLSWDSRRHI